MSQTYTHKDLAGKLNVSETTIKSYRRKFPDCIPVGSQGKPIRFLPEAVGVCTRIRDLFDLGMSIEEVRTRLSQEFPWISLIAREEPSGQPESSVLPQEFTVALSNLAKSMVTLLQQQNAIKERLNGLEASIAEAASQVVSMPQPNGGAKATDFKAVLEDLQGYLRNALMPLQQLQRLNEVQGVTEVLHQAASNMVDAAQIMRSLADRAKTQGSNPESPSKIVQFPSAAQQAVTIATNPGQDPPRAFLLRPMVVRTAEGAYIGAGGKTRGRFTLNDFKALLVYGRQPGEHFSIHWEQSGSDWVAALTRQGTETPGKWRLQMKEAMSQSGVGVVELAGFTANGEDVHPAEFVSFVASLSGVDC